ncbi:MAG: hypothetical protein KatS3mg023_3866 [Armatimonadota bacterium]|nr:MAG: hypothetical protein KatS3mg023_3866 [Armatimonadota bacterium]
MTANELWRRQLQQSAPTNSLAAIQLNLTRNIPSSFSLYGIPQTEQDEPPPASNLSTDLQNINLGYLGGPQTVNHGYLYQTSFARRKTAFNPYNPLHFMQL